MAIAVELTAVCRRTVFWKAEVLLLLRLLLLPLKCAPGDARTAADLRATLQFIDLRSKVVCVRPHPLGLSALRAAFAQGLALVPGVPAGELQEAAARVVRGEHRSQPGAAAQTGGGVVSFAALLLQS